MANLPARTTHHKRNPECKAKAPYRRTCIGCGCQFLARSYRHERCAACFASLLEALR